VVSVTFHLATSINRLIGGEIQDLWKIFKKIIEYFHFIEAIVEITNVNLMGATPNPQNGRICSVK
jgi:hypothetical protein